MREHDKYKTLWNGKRGRSGLSLYSGGGGVKKGLSCGF